jgi:hypothetical protein
MNTALKVFVVYLLRYRVYGTLYVRNTGTVLIENASNVSGSDNLQEADIDRKVILKFVRKGRNESMLTGLM